MHRWLAWRWRRSERTRSQVSGLSASAQAKAGWRVVGKARTGSQVEATRDDWPQPDANFRTLPTHRLHRPTGHTARLTKARDTRRHVTSQSLRLATEIVEAVGRRDVSRLIELTDPDVEWRPFASGLMEDGVYRGHDGIRQYVRDLHDAWELLSADVDDGLAVGTTVLLVGRLRYRGRGSGVEMENAAGWAIKFQDGRLISMRAFRDPERAIQALGSGVMQPGGSGR